MDDLKLWQLISPTLPIGSYAYSQGFESAVERKLVVNEEQAFDWISGLLRHSLGRLDAPVYLRLINAWKRENIDELIYWQQFLQASRESSELLAEDQQLGTALRRLLNDLFDSDVDNECFQNRTNHIQSIQKPSFLLIYSLAVVSWDINQDKALKGFLWAWCENQVAAAIKLVPLGQTSGQKILKRMIPVIDGVVEVAQSIDDNDIGAFNVGLSMLSAQHEQQYSRLFRS